MDVKSLLVKFGTDTKAMEAGFKKADGYVQSHAAKFKQAGMAMTIAGGAIIGIVGGLVKAYADFDDKLTQSTAIMGDVSDAMKTKMGEAAKQMSEESTFAAAELAEAYYFLASAGMGAEQAIAALPAVTAFATAGAFDLASATDLLTDAQSALGLSTDDVVKNQENMVMVSDALVMANTLANASVSQFSEALTNKAGPAMRAYDISLESGVAVLAAFADQGIKGKQAGEKYSIVLRDLQKATLDNSDAFDKAGIAVYDATGNLNNMGDIIGQLETRFDGMTAEQKKAELGMLGFQEESQTVLLTLLGTSEKIKEYEKALKSAGGTTETVARKQLASLTSQLTMAKNTAVNAAISIGEQLAPMIAELAETVSKTVKKIGVWIKAHPELVKWIAETALKVGILLAVVGPMLIMLPKIAAGLKLVKVAFLALQSPIGLAGIAILAVVVALKDMMKTMDDAKKAMADMATESEVFADIAENFKKLWIAVREEGGTTLEQFNELMTRFGGNWEKIMNTIIKDPSFAVLKALMLDIAGGVKEVDLAGEELSISFPDSFLKASKGPELLVKAVFAANEAILGVTKELNDELQQCYESDYQTAKRHLADKLADRITAINEVKAVEGAGADEIAQLNDEKNAAIALANKTHAAELLVLSEENAAAEAEIQKTLTENITTLWSDFWAAVKIKQDEQITKRQEYNDAIKSLIWSELDYALEALEEEKMARDEAIIALLGDTKEAEELLLFSHEEYLRKKKELYDAAAEEDTERELNKYKELEKMMNKVLGWVSYFVSAIDHIWAELYNNAMIRIDNEEKRRLESIDLQYNAQIEAAEALLEAERAKTEEILKLERDKTDELMRLEQEKTEEILASITNEYEEKKAWIEENVKDEDKKTAQLLKLQADYEDELKAAGEKRADREQKLRIDREAAEKKALEDREIAEKETADYLEQLEEDKAEALRILSEDLEEKRSDARRTAAKQEKAVALMSAVVNTAAGVVKALSAAPPPFNLILAAITAAAGAIQIGIIAARPIPLAEGGIVMQPTQALIGEAGPEAIIPLNKLGVFGGLQPAPVTATMTFINYGDINNVGDLDAISDRLGKRFVQQIERGRS